MMKTNNNKKY